MKEEAENLLKELWLSVHEGLKERGDINDSLREYLLDEGLIKFVNDKISLTEEGERRARKIIRLHRLAERLLNDVLGMGESKIEESACKFEHIISDEVEEAICTLLGHPTVCPHGFPIPPGNCCIKGEREVERLIFRLSELSPGDEGVIKYVVGGKDLSNKVVSFGLLPGEKLKIIRVFPTFIIQMGNTQFALDRDLASAIFVLKHENNGEKKEEEKHGFFRKRRRKGWE
jgi:DtxR family Mn-dependent transcriptional regulator